MLSKPRLANAAFPNAKPTKNWKKANSRRLSLQQTRRVSAQDRRAIRLRNIQSSQNVQHLGNAADLVWIIAAGQNMPGPREGNCQLDAIRIEVHRVVVELRLQELAGRAIDVHTAIGEGVKSAV